MKNADEVMEWVGRNCRHCWKSNFGQEDKAKWRCKAGWDVWHGFDPGYGSWDADEALTRRVEFAECSRRMEHHPPEKKKPRADALRGIY
jgi:hypothetical protein